MAKTVAIAFGNEAFIRANQTISFSVTVTNDATAVQLKSLVISEESKLGAQLGQPVFLLAGQPWDSSFPTLAASGSASYGFEGMIPSPNFPGPSATNPGGANPGQLAEPSANSQLVLRATAVTSDGTVFISPPFTAPVLSATAPFPVSDVGSAQFRQGGNSNLIAVL